MKNPTCVLENGRNSVIFPSFRSFTSSRFVEGIFSNTLIMTASLCSHIDTLSCSVLSRFPFT